MGERTSYEPGTFCAVDLGTSDAAGAKPFYTQLFGWEAEDVPTESETKYTMLRLNGKVVAGIFERADFPHPAWVSYVSVENADAIAKRAGELGGNVVQEPSDIMTAGRLAIIQDPPGAAFALWQPNEFPGAELVNDPGAFTLNQLNTSDTEAGKSFYGELFGWRVEQVSTGEQEYWGLYNGNDLNGGMMPLPEQAAQAGAPPHWLVYFTSTDVDAAASRIGELGGQVTVPPMAIPGVASEPGEEVSGGRICVAQDAQGAAFGLFEGRTDP